MRSETETLEFERLQHVTGLANLMLAACRFDGLEVAAGLVTIAQILAGDDKGGRALLAQVMIDAAGKLDPEVDQSDRELSLRRPRKEGSASRQAGSEIDLSEGGEHHTTWLELTRMILEWEDGYETASSLAKKIVSRFWLRHES